MPNPYEEGPEMIPGIEEVMEIINRRVENAEKAVVEKQLSDEKGIYLLVLKVEGDKPGKYTEVYYTRKGTHSPNTVAATTGIDIVSYEDDMPTGGEPIAKHDSKTGVWEEVE